MSPSNAWSRRRQTIKRPPVCESRPKPQNEGLYPTSVDIELDWSQFDSITFDQNTYGPLTKNWPQSAVANIYGSNGVNDQGDTWIGAFTLNISPGMCTMLITMTSGHFSGETITGTCPGWDQSHPWTNGDVLNGSLANLTGSFSVTVS